MFDLTKDVCIIGGGPSGVSAAIYLKRYGMNPIIYEKEIIGGKVNKTDIVENYLGVLPSKGINLGETLESQLSNYDIDVIYKEVKSLSKNEDGTYLVKTSKDERIFKYVIIAIGLGEKPFPIKGEDSFNKKGISRCAICDGAFYKGKDVGVIGAGNSAFEEGLYLANICKSVTLIARRSEYRADKSAVTKFKSTNNCKILSPYNVISASGKNQIESLTIKNSETNEELTLNISGLFIYVGDSPISQFIQIEEIKMSEGILITNSNMETNIRNLYAIGDCRNTSLKQIVTAASDGAIAAASIFDNFKNN